MISRRNFSLFAASGALLASSQARAQVPALRRSGIVGTWRLTAESHSVRQRSAFDPEVGPLDPTMVVRASAVTLFTIEPDLSASSRTVATTSAVNVIGAAASGASNSDWATWRVESGRKGRLVPVSGADGGTEPDSGALLVFDFVLDSDTWLSRVASGPQAGETFEKRVLDPSRVFVRLHFASNFEVVTAMTPRALGTECECGQFSSRTFDAVGLKLRA